MLTYGYSTPNRGQSTGPRDLRYAIPRNLTHRYDAYEGDRAPKQCPCRRPRPLTLARRRRSDAGNGNSPGDDAGTNNITGAVMAQEMCGLPGRIQGLQGT